MYNCGDYNWMVLIDLKDGKVEVCYYDIVKMGEMSCWYVGVVLVLCFGFCFV